MKRDDDGAVLFAEDHEHKVLVYNDLDGDKEVDVIKTGGNIWFHASSAVELMGMSTDDAKNTARTLKRIDHPDIIKIKDTPFRFPDGRRNRGSFLSPRAIAVLAEKKTKNYNPFKALRFRDWMQDEILMGQPPKSWSPAKHEKSSFSPTFHAVIKEQPEDHPELDPLRPIGLYLPMVNMPPLQPYEIEFCLCHDTRNGLGKCWCRRKGGIRVWTQDHIQNIDDEDGPLDEEDVFEVITEIVTHERFRTVPAC